MNAVKYLERIQVEALARSGKKIIDYGEAEGEQILQQMIPDDVPDAANLRDKLRRRIKEMFQKRKPLTRFENPLLYQVLVDLAEAIETAAEKQSRKIAQRPVIGTLSFGRVNAMSVRLPETEEHLIIFQDQLFTFANLFAKAVAQAIPIVSEGERYGFSVAREEVLEFIEKNGQSVRRFEEVLLAYLFLGSPSAAPPYVIAGGTMRVAELLRAGMELFVLGHEYGHIAAGHLSGNVASARLSMFSEDAEEILWNWQQEVDADTIGLELTLVAQLTRGYDVSLSYWGCDLLLSCFDVVERSLALARGVEIQISPTHPPSSVRKERLRKVVVRMIGEEHGPAVMSLADASDVIVEALWQKVAPRIEQMAKSMPLSPMWSVQ